MFLVLLLTMVNTFGGSVGVQLLLTGHIIVGGTTAASGDKAVGQAICTSACNATAAPNIRAPRSLYQN